jgi:hypothetical protein
LQELSTEFFVSALIIQLAGPKKFSFDFDGLNCQVQLNVVFGPV